MYVRETEPTHTNLSIHPYRETDRDRDREKETEIESLWFTKVKGDFSHKELN